MKRHTKRYDLFYGLKPKYKVLYMVFGNGNPPSFIWKINRQGKVFLGNVSWNEWITCDTPRADLMENLRTNWTSVITLKDAKRKYSTMFKKQRRKTK